MISNKKYKIIYADPPWEYGNYSNTKDMRHFDHNKGVFDSKFKITPYKGMDVKEIKSLPVQEISEKNSVCCLWVTMPCLKWGFDVLEAWGFEYKTVLFTWVKRYKHTGGYFIGLGNYTRANAELCLLGIHGSVPGKSKKISQIIDSPIRSHSKKPDIARTRIIKVFGDLSRIELFARTKVHGWDVWGNDLRLKDITLEPFNLYNPN